MDEKKVKKGKRRKGSVFGRIMALLGITLLCIVLTLFGIVWVFEKGPSPTLTGIFCNSVRETSILRWMSRIYLSEEELEPYILKSTEDLETEQVNTSLIHIASPEEKKEKGEESEPYLQLIDIAYGTCKGKLLIVDGDKIKFGDNPEDFRWVTDRIDAELFGLFPFESDAQTGKEI